MKARYSNLLNRLDPVEVLRELTDPILNEFPEVMSLHWSMYRDEDDEYCISDISIRGGDIIDVMCLQPYNTLAMVIKNPERWGTHNLGDMVKEKYPYLNIDNIDRFINLFHTAQAWMYSNTEYLGATLGYSEVTVTHNGIEFSIDDE